MLSDESSTRYARTLAESKSSVWINNTLQETTKFLLQYFYIQESGRNAKRIKTLFGLKQRHETRQRQ